MMGAPPLRIAAVEIDGAVTRPLLLDRPFGETVLAALREAMLKRGCLRDRAHKGQCLGCALVPQCAVWPLVAPADPTRHQRGAYLRPFVLRTPTLAAARLPVGTRLTFGATLLQDGSFPAKWSAFAAAFVQAARQVAEWGIGAPVRIGEQAARKGAIAVARVRWVHPLTGATAPYQHAAPQEDSLPLAVTWGEPTETDTPDDTLRLTFLTPTRLVVAGQSLRAPEPVVLVRRLAERLDSVAAAMRAAPPDLLRDGTLLEAAARLTIARDETAWTGDAARGGFVGAVTLAGAPDDRARVLPALRWGAALGVGKGTLEGLGRFALGPPPATAYPLPPAEPEAAPPPGAQGPARRSGSAPKRRNAPRPPGRPPHGTPGGRRTPRR